MKRRGFLAPIPPARRGRFTSNTRGDSSDTGGADVPIWNDPIREDSHLNDSQIVEEDIEPIIDEAPVLQTRSTNLMGVQFDDGIGTGEEDEEKEDVNSRLTVGGDVLEGEDEENIYYRHEEGLAEEDVIQDLVVVEDRLVDLSSINQNKPESPMDDVTPAPESPDDIFRSPVPEPSNLPEDPEPQTLDDSRAPYIETYPSIPESTDAPDKQPEGPGTELHNVNEVGVDVPFDGPNPKFLNKCVEDFHLAVMLFVTSSDLSGTQYEALAEVLALVTDIESLRSLPKSIQTLKDRCRKSFPLMKVQGRLVDLESNSIPPKKQNPRHAYFFDPSEYCRIWLSSPRINATIYKGLGEFVDDTSELWHGDAWKESVRSTSGQFARIHDGKTVLLPSDCVTYRDTQGRTHMGRVKCVGIDRRGIAGAAVGQESVLINRLIPPNELSEIWRRALNEERNRDREKGRVRPSMPMGKSVLPELVLMENREIVPCSSITSRIWVYFTDYQTIEELEQSVLPFPPAYCVRYIGYVSEGRAAFRPTDQRHRLLAELELQQLSREYVLREMVEDNTQDSDIQKKKIRRVSIPYSAFLDGFGLYRNAYYSLKGMYITPAGMNVYQRTRLHNLYVLMIGPLCNEIQMAAALERDALTLGKGEIITLHTGEEVFLTAFPLLLTGDMPQQNQNSGNKTHNAEFGCRSCFVPEHERGNLTFKIEENGRYRPHMEYLRKDALSSGSKAARDKALQKHGLSEAGPYFARCYTMLDPQRCTPNDPMHAELRLCKYFAEALLEGILSAEGIRAYRAAWAEVDVPYRWGQPQNPVNHKGSMVFSEHGRVAIINPFVLMHMFTNDEWEYHSGKPTDELIRIRSSYIKRMAAVRFDNKRTNGELEWIASESSLINTIYNVIVKAAYMLARASTLAMKEVLDPTDKETFKLTLVTSRKLLQVIFACASSDKKSFKNYGNVPNVHLALHYKNDIDNFGSARNAGTMVGEQKHKIFKNHATHTNSKDSDLQLMKSTNTSQTIRLMLDGSFTSTAPDISKQIQLIVARCPILRTKFLGTSGYMCEQGEADTETAPNDYMYTEFDLERSPFSKARTGRHIPLGKISTNARSLDLSTLKDAILSEYGATIWSGTRMKVGYWGFFGADTKTPPGEKGDRFRIAVNQIIRVLGHGRERTGCFYIVMRIMTVTVGSIIRTLCVLKELERMYNEETRLSPYNVFRLTESAGLFMYGVRDVEPVVHHFVKKGPNVWWQNAYIPNFL